MPLISDASQSLKDSPRKSAVLAGFPSCGRPRGGSRRMNRLKSGYRAARGWTFLGVRNDGVSRVELSPDSVCIRQTML